MPINSLPNELLSNIFLDAISEDQCDEIHFNRFPVAKHLTEDFQSFRCVCHRWNSVLLNDARQWDVFYVNGLASPTFNSPIIRSRARPIRIVIKTKRNPFGSHNWMPLLATLLKLTVLSRCVGIFLEMDVEELQSTLQEWSDTPAPLLRSLCLRAVYSSTGRATKPLRLFSAHVPSLRRIMISGMIVDWEQSGIPFDKLRVLRVESEFWEINTSLFGLENGVAQARSLTQLSIKDSRTTVTLSSALISDRIESLALSSDDLGVGPPLTGLKACPSTLTSLFIGDRFDFHGEIEPFLDFLEQMKCLKRFTFTASVLEFPDIDDAATLPLRIHGLGRLQEMHVQLDVISSAFAFALLASFPFQSLNTLQIRRNVYGYQSFWDRAADIDIIWMFLDRLDDRTFPALEHLTCDIMDGAILSFFLHLSPHLESLSVYDELHLDEDESMLLKSLTYEKACETGFLCPRLARVSIYMEMPEEERDKASDAEYEAWKAERAPFAIKVRLARKAGAERGLCKEIEEFGEDEQGEDEDDLDDYDE
ncbi:hypothetical protein SISNIDRAFT_463521 [Sistotremastrum niveocremeum HHB9708]|uniref:F-box domain-containing protein n=1 Tax=Sistotremastrum niveocremeum HHB9708 TaxID=1314777 RepID=A0A164YBG5_9AGAM|nr:hypothetical protein SISNIDRAFT_463521 [Sistotremastrum niveocremeum HHB9708]